MVDSVTDQPLPGPEVEENAFEDHIALIYESTEERLAAITPLIRVGLEKGELCLYISNDENDRGIVEALKAEHIDVEKAVGTGGLILTSKKEIYFKLGRFDPDWTIRVINNIADLAKSYGFTAMRIMSEMTWTQETVPGVERWPEYEAKMNALNPGISLRIICQYDRRAFPAESLLAALRTHPKVVSQGAVSKNTFFIPADRLLKGDYATIELERTLDSIRASNHTEAELQNRDQLIDQMRKLVDGHSVARRSLEVALEESRRRFNELAERSSDWAWELDGTGAYSYSSSRVRDILGLNPEEVLGRRPMDLVSKEEADRVSAILTRAMSSQAPITALEKEVKHKDGRSVFLEMNGTPIFDRDGNFLGYRGIDRDITGRKAAKQAIEESRRRAEEAATEVEARDARILALEQDIGQLMGAQRERDAAVAAIQEALKASQMDMAQAGEDLERLRNALRAREEENRTAQAAMEAKQAEMDKSKASFILLQQNLVDKEVELSDIRSRLATASAAEQDKGTALAQLTDKFKASTLELIAVRGSLEGAEEAVSRKEEELVSLRQQSDRMETELREMKDAFLSKAADLVQVQDQLGRTNEALELRTSELAARAEEIAGKENALAELQTANLSLQETVAAREKEMAERKLELDALDGEARTVREQLARSSADVTSKEATILELQTALAAREREIEQRMEELAAREEEVRSTKEELDKSRQEVSLGESRLSEVQTTLAAREEELGVRMGELGASREEARANEEESAKLRSEVSALQTTLAEVRSALATGEQELAERSVELEARQGEVRAANEELASLRSELAAKDTALNEAETTLAVRETELGERMMELGAREEEARATGEELKGVKAELTAKTAALAEAIALSEAAKAENALRCEEAQQARMDRELLEREKDQLIQVIQERDGQLAEQQEQTAKFSGELLVKEEELAAAGTLLAEREHDLGRQRSMHEQLELTLRVKEEELTATLAAVRAKDQALNDSKQEIDSLLEDIRTRNERIDRLLEDLSKVERDLVAKENALVANQTVIQSKDVELARLGEMAGQLTSELQAVRATLDSRDAELAEDKEALSESNDRFRALFDQAGAGIVRVDLDGRLLEANGRFYDLLGYEPGELAGKTFRDLTHRDDLVESAAMYRRLVSGEVASVSSMKRYLRRLGSVVWANVTMSVVKDADGNARYIMAIVDDRTDQMLAEQALREKEERENEERYRNVVENAPEGVWVLDTEGRTTFVNQRMATLLGYAPEEMVGQPAARFMNQQWREQQEESTDGLGNEVRFVRKDGTDLWVIISSMPVLDQAGQSKGALGLVSDITALKVKQRLSEAGRAAAVRERDQFLSMFESMSAPLAIVAPDGMVVRTNPALERLLSSSSLVGYQATAIWPGLDLDAPARFKLTIDGQEKELEFLPSPFGAGEVQGTVLAVREAPALKEEAAEDSMAQRSASLAHDLNDTLTVIMGSVSLAKEYVIPEGRMYSKLKQIESASVTASDLAHRLMTVSKGGTEGDEAAPVPATPLVKGKGKILLMDDDESILEATGDLLRYLGYTVEVAREGEEALAMCSEAREARQPFELAILDLSIAPGMGGMEASKKLREENPGLKLIASSGYVHDPALTDPASVGFAAAMPKPYAADLLSKIVAEVLARQ